MDVNPSDPTHLAALASAYRATYGAGEPAAVVRAPGRVNLIGEHIDYLGLQVLPMAIQRQVALAFAPRDDAIVRLTTLSPGFGALEFTLDTDIPAGPTGDWGNYVKAAAQALVRAHGELRGFDGVLGSTLPVAAGLSSSSALVVAVALTLEYRNRRRTPPLALAEAMARAERYTGTQGGGMDQAICLMAKIGTATRIDFQPLRAAARPVPDGWRFVVAHSLVRAEKSGAAQQRYNERTRECAVALAAVAARLGLAGHGYRELLRSSARDTLVSAGDAALSDPVRRRFRHAVTEAHRVTQAEDALVSGDLAAFGRLLSASHASLRDDYEVSIPALDELVAVAERGGAAGARLTGAGMGGCIVAVCDAERVGHLLTTLRGEYYGEREVQGSVDDYLFVADPSGAARVEVLG
jgi:galactokinase